MKIDGYYYNIYTEQSYQSLRIYFLYKDGKLLSAPNFKNLLKADDCFKSKTFKKNIRDTTEAIASINWTNYSIIDSSILLEEIYPRQTYPHFIVSGHIINDTTFIIKKTKGIAHISLGDGKIKNLDDTFHFKEFYPKPDSISFGKYVSRNHVQKAKSDLLKH